MMRIYNFARGARGIRVAWQCEEMGLAYKPALLPFPTPPAFRAKHPSGAVPFLEDGEVALGESVAIMLYLVKRYGPTGLFPTEPVAGARTLELVVASEAALGAPINLLLAAKFAAPEPDRRNWSVGLAEKRVAETLDRLSSALGGGNYLVGADLTLADIAIATALNIWAGGLAGAMPPPLEAWRKRLMLRPAYAKAAAAFAG